MHTPTRCHPCFSSGEAAFSVCAVSAAWRTGSDAKRWVRRVSQAAPTCRGLRRRLNKPGKPL